MSFIKPAIHPWSENAFNQSYGGDDGQTRDQVAAQIILQAYLDQRAHA